MMIQTLLSVVSVIIAAVGIPILYLQVKDLKASVRSSAHAAIYNQAETLRGYLVQYPHLRKYFFDNEDITSKDVEYNRVISIAEIYLNYLEHITVTQDSFGKKNVASLKRFISSAFEKSPILKQHLKNNAPLYSDALHTIVEKE